MTCHTTHILPLDQDRESLYENLSDSHRRHLKKAGRFECEIRPVINESDVREYARLAAGSTARLGLSARYDLDFYTRLLRLVPKDQLVWRLLYLDGKACVGHLCFKWANEIISWDGCSNELGRATSVNYTLYWHNITEFSQKRCTAFNFGSSPRGVSGVVHFKTGWGAEETAYYEYERRSLLYRAAHRVKGWVRK
jgi:hypothetical protein